MSELEHLVKRNPFKKYEASKDVMLCVVFLVDEPKTKPKLPLVSATEKLEVFAVADRTVFVIMRRKKTGWFSFPNNFVEKQFDILGTTRQWSTVKKILKAAQE